MNDENRSLENFNKYPKLLEILVLSIIITILAGFSWKQHKQLINIQSKLDILEKNNSSQAQTPQLPNQATSNLQAMVDTLQKKYDLLAHNIQSNDTIDASEYGSELRSTLRLATLASMYLFLGKNEKTASELLRQAINKLIKLNDPRLNPVLYNLQDEYSKLSNNDNINYSVAVVWKKIDEIKLLIDKLENNGLDLDDFFVDPVITKKQMNIAIPENISTNNISPISHNASASNTINEKLSYLKIELLYVYLEQTKLAYLQNDDFLFKQTIASIRKIIDLGFWSPQLTQEIKEHLTWLDTITIRNYPLILQAILNLEDLVK